MSQSEQDFFNCLAEGWDDLRADDRLKIGNLVDMVGFMEGDRVLDIGSGTGVLLPFLRNAVGDGGLITAIDFAANMINRSEEKHRHLSGITYVVDDIMKFQSEASFDKAVCLNFFPHAADKVAFILKIRELLIPYGTLVIMHDLSRAAVNGIHQSSEIVKNDRLPEGSKVAEMLAEAGYEVKMVLDNDELYYIKAVKN